MGKKKKQRKYNKIVIGIDQACQNTGVAVIGDGKLLHYRAINVARKKGNTVSRKELAKATRSLIKKSIKRAKNVEVIVERIRLFSRRPKEGEDGGRYMVAVKYIKTAATLIATIVDAAHDYGVKVYSVDTRSWKSKILGSSKSTGYAPNLSSSTRKDTSIFFVQRKYKIDISYTVQRGKNKGQTRYNDNIADAICMALYGFLDENIKKLQLEA